MAIYFLNLKTFGRSDGSSAVSAAAYRSGERIRDERTGRIYDHSDRQDVMHKEIVLPSDFRGDQLAWAQDRAALWNTAEQAETRRNARVAREYLVALPAELSAEQRVELIRGFSRELVDRYRFAVDAVIHAPRDFPDSDPRNFHAHLLATTREVTVAGLGAKTTLEWRDSMRREAGLGPAVNELFHVRERWASVTNQALEAAHIDARIDHRTLQAQGIDREPRLWIPRVAFEMERQGYRSEVAERLRAEHQARLDARLDRSAREAASVRVESGISAGRSAGDAATKPVPGREIETPGLPPAVNPAQSRSIDDIQRQAVQNWLRYRENQLRSPPAEQEQAITRSRDRDNDYSL
jgi:ATP-dependent exoDNAse (exonuclease V) alpha subunit